MSEQNNNNYDFSKGARLFQIGAIIMIAYVIFFDFTDKQRLKDFISPQQNRPATPVDAPCNCDEHEESKPLESEADKDSLNITDTIEGEGRPARCGDEVTLNYSGFLPSGEVFEDTFDIGIPVSFDIGADDVIEGFEKGIIGMRKGGIRQIIVPPDMAFEQAPQTTVPVLPNSTIWFSVEMLDIKPDTGGGNLDLQYIDKKTGTGKQALCGSEVEIKYMEYAIDGNALQNMEESISFTLGKGLVPNGLEAGIEGMKEGGVRFLIIPSAFLKTKSDEPLLTIESNEIIHMEVSLEKVE